MKKHILYFIFFVIHISNAQSKNNFLSEFTFEQELKSKNLIDNFVNYDFYKIFSNTKNQNILGIIGKNHQRIRIKLTSVIKDSIVQNKYLVNGKSSVEGNLCDFNGEITLLKIYEYKDFEYGVDSIYVNEIKSQGILIAKYDFKENAIHKHSGVFKGKLYTRWYINHKDQLKYDNILSHSDGYNNNAFVGIWKSYKTNVEKICNWADYRVPLANKGFDTGAAEFSPSEKYLKYGWENYQKAWLNQDKKAQEIELSEWWKLN